MPAGAPSKGFSWSGCDPFDFTCCYKLLLCYSCTAAQSKVDVTFWEPLGSLKLHSLKLDEGPVPLRAFWASSDRAEQPGLLTVTAASLAAAAEPEAAEVTAVPVPPRSFAAQGDLYVLNSVNRLLKFDRKAAVQQVGQA